MAKYTAKCLASTYVSGFHNVEAVMAMPYSAFGNTGRVVSAFSYGASALGGVFTDGAVDEAEASQVVQYIIKNGVNLIDTAPWYGFGKAEAVLGKALKGIPREAYYLHTKVGRYEADILKRFDFSYERTLRSIDESLERLGVRYIDTVQVHDPEFAPSLDIILTETLPAITEAIRLNKVRSIGITGYPLETLRWLADNSPVPIDSAISYCHHTLHDTSLVTSGTLRHLQSKGLGVINASPLSMGLLTSKGPPDWHVASPELKAACNDASEFAASRGVDFARIALAFAAGNPVIPTTMGSAATMAEIIPNMDLITGKNPLNDEEKLVLSQVRSRYFNEERMTSIASWEGAEVTKYWVKVGKQLATNMYSGLHARRKAEKPVRDLYS